MTDAKGNPDGTVYAPDGAIVNPAAGPIPATNRSTAAGRVIKGPSTGPTADGRYAAGPVELAADGFVHAAVQQGGPDFLVVCGRCGDAWPCSLAPATAAPVAAPLSDGGVKQVGSEPATGLPIVQPVEAVTYDPTTGRQITGPAAGPVLVNPTVAGPAGPVAPVVVNPAAPVVETAAGPVVETAAGPVVDNGTQTMTGDTLLP